MSDEVKAPQDMISVEPEVESYLQSVQDAPVIKVDLSTEFWKPEPGEQIRAIFLGVTHRDVPDKKTGELKPLEVVLLATVDKDTGGTVVKMHGGTQLVNTLREYPVKHAYDIVCVGKVKGANSGMEYNKFSIYKVDSKPPAALTNIDVKA